MKTPFWTNLLAASNDVPGRMSDLMNDVEKLADKAGAFADRLGATIDPDNPASFLQLFGGAIGAEDPSSRFIRLLTVFLLAMWVGFEVITKVPQRLHTPLTSGSNAISGITAVGAIVVAGSIATAGFRFGNLLGLLAVVLAMINVAGGFVVTHRMLEMFNPKKK